MIGIRISALLSLVFVSQSGLAADPATENTNKAKSGYQLGSFTAKPNFGLTTIYDDNVFSTRTNTESDQVLLFSPSVDITSDWSKHELNFSASADVGRYDDFDTEDYDDYYLGTSGRFDINDNANLFGGLNYSEEHESRASPDSFFGRYPTEFSSAEAHFGTEQRFGNIGMRLGGTFQQLDYDDVPTDSGTLNNDDRDRDVYGAGLRLSFAKNQSFSPFAQLIYDRREYKDTFDDNNFRRDSDGYRLAAGFSSNITNRLRSEVYIGHMWQDFDDSRFSNISKPDFGAAVRWRANPSTLISADVERSIVETTLYDASSAIETSYGASLNHRLLPDLTVKAHASLSHYDYQGISRDDDYAEAGFGLEYDLTRNIYISGSYRYLHRDSNIDYATLDDSLDYYRHQFFLTVGARLYPVKTPLASSLAGLWGQDYSSESGPAGFYIGGQLGYNMLDSHLSEDRDSGGSDDASFGEADFAGGVFGGYGFNFNRWYLGLELEAENSKADWHHRKAKDDSRTFDLAKNETYGASIRLGRALINNGLFYGRIGAVRTEFDGYYTLNDSVENAYNKDFDLTGMRFGVGVEFDLTENLFARMDYTVTNYEDERISSVDFNEKYGIHESLFNLGIGWRFGDVPKHTVSINPDEFTGPYAGFQAGYGMTSSDLSGLHRDQGTGPYAFNADFADHGFTPGIFLGYGINWQRLLVALELEGEVTSLQWEHDRETSGGGGRDFSVEVRETIGAGLKLGYILDSGTVFYVRGGAVRTDFTTTWRKGNNRDKDIERDDKLNGLRFGVGTEVPLTESSFIRLDYTHTTYESYDFVTTHGDGSNSDEMSFDHTTDLVRLGIGTRF